jgi:hypothetical protein
MAPELDEIFDALPVAQLESLGAAYVDALEPATEYTIHAYQTDQQVDAHQLAQWTESVDGPLCLVTNSTLSTEAHAQFTAASEWRLVTPDVLRRTLTPAQVRTLTDHFTPSLRPVRDDMDVSALKGIASDEHIHARLVNSLFESYAPIQVRFALALQLFRGSDPVHVLCLGDRGDVVGVVDDLGSHATQRYVDGKTTTIEALVGQHDDSGRRLARGLGNRLHDEVLVLDRAADLEDVSALREPLGRGRFSVATPGGAREYMMAASCLALADTRVDETATASTPHALDGLSGLFDAFVSTHRSLQSVDPPLVEVRTTSTLAEDALVGYIRFANQLTPTVDEDVATYMQSTARDLAQSHPAAFTETALVRALRRLARASARMRLSETVSAEDVDLVSTLVGDPLHRPAISYDDAMFEQSETPDPSPAPEQPPSQPVQTPPSGGDISRESAEHAWEPPAEADAVLEALDVLQSEYSDGVPEFMLVDVARNVMGQDASAEGIQEAIEQLTDENRLYDTGGQTYIRANQQ